MAERIALVHRLRSCLYLGQSCGFYVAACFILSLLNINGLTTDVSHGAYSLRTFLINVHVDSEATQKFLVRFGPFYKSHWKMDLERRPNLFPDLAEIRFCYIFSSFGFQQVSVFSGLHSRRINLPGARNHIMVDHACLENHCFEYEVWLVGIRNGR